MKRGELCNCRIPKTNNGSAIDVLTLCRPVRTFNTAVIYYHKFRLVHKDNEYQYADAGAAGLFTACKIEDTLKKSKEILCASHNLKVTASEHLTPDDGVSLHHLGMWECSH